MTLTQELLQNIINLVIIPILPVLAGFFVALIRKKSAEIKQTMDNKELQKQIEIAEDAVCTAVVAVQNIYVETNKKYGTFDEAAQKEAFEMARSRVLLLLKDSTKESLSAAYGSLDGWIDNKIDYYINKNK